MADPHVLYIVSAVVVLGLVAWVIVVLARAPALPETPAKGAETPAKGAAEAKEPAEPERKESAKPQSKPRLDAHLEIQDEKAGDDKPPGA